MIRLEANEDGVREAAMLVREGRVILWPSGGVYGLATSALSAEGMDRIYLAKRRPRDRPLQVLASSSVARDLAVIPRAAEAIMRRVWPGFVGFVVPRKSPQLRSVAGPGDTVLLVCSNWVADRLASIAGVPVVATSANLSGGHEILTPDAAAGQFVETVAAIIDGGTQSGGLNTVVDLSRRPYRILRQGAVAAEEVMAIVAEAGEK